MHRNPSVRWSCCEAALGTDAYMWFISSQMEFDEKDLRREISYAIKNIHGVRQVPRGTHNLFLSIHVGPRPFESLTSEAFRRFMASFQNCINVLVLCVLAL